MNTNNKQEELSFHIIGDAFCDLFCFLENDLPERGGDARLTRPVHVMAGGSAVNTATHLTSLLKHKRQHPTVSLHTSVNPNDDYGKLLIDHASKHGFPLINSARRHDSSTGHCVVIVAKEERSFMTHQGCMNHFSASDLNVSSLVKATHIHIGGYYNIPGFWNGQLKNTLTKIRHERSHKNAITLVPQHDATGEWNGQLLDLLPLLDFVIMNELEADCISRTKDDIDAWASFFAHASPTTCIVVTRGNQGAVAIRDGKVVASQAAVQVKDVVDPTGAGDAFCSGFIHGLWERKSPSTVEAIQNGLSWGCAVATSSIQTHGASVPSPPERIRDLLNKASTSSSES